MPEKRASAELHRAGTGGAALKRIDLAEDTRDALSMVRQLTPKAVTLSAEVTEEPLPVLGREGIMQHILMNLCKNALY